MAVDISDAVRNAMVNAFAAQVDGGSGAGKVMIFTGAKPANCAAADPAGLVATLPGSDPFFGSGAAGVATANDIPAVAASAGGVAASFRIKDSANVVCMQGTVGEGSGDMSFDETTWNAGDTIDITSLTVTQPAS